MFYTLLHKHCNLIQTYSYSITALINPKTLLNLLRTKLTYLETSHFSPQNAFDSINHEIHPKKSLPSIPQSISPEKNTHCPVSTVAYKFFDLPNIVSPTTVVPRVRFAHKLALLSDSTLSIFQCPGVYFFMCTDRCSLGLII